MISAVARNNEKIEIKIKIKYQIHYSCIIQVQYITKFYNYTSLTDNAPVSNSHNNNQNPIKIDQSNSCTTVLVPVIKIPIKITYR